MYNGGGKNFLLMVDIQSIIKRKDDSLKRTLHSFYQPVAVDMVQKRYLS